jgi:hypothetical protein
LQADLHHVLTDDEDTVEANLRLLSAGVLVVARR